MIPRLKKGPQKCVPQTFNQDLIPRTPIILCSHDSVTEAMEKEKGGVRFADYGAMASPLNMTIPSLFWGYFGQFREATKPVLG